MLSKWLSLWVTTVIEAMGKFKKSPIVLLLMAIFALAAWVILGVQTLGSSTSFQITEIPSTISPTPKPASPSTISPIPKPASPITTVTDSGSTSSSELIKEWSGTDTRESLYISSKKTETFDIAEAPWIVVWSFEPKAAKGHGALLQIYVLQTNNASYIELPVYIGNVSELQQDSFEVNDVGNFYLQIYSRSGSWEVKVLDNK